MKSKKIRAATVRRVVILTEGQCTYLFCDQP